MKLSITGSRGMLATDLKNIASQAGHETIGWDVDELDITNQSQVQTKIDEIKPEVIINCAAYTAVDQAETEREKCRTINVDGVKNLVNICLAQDIILIQISTDYVFNGQKASYNEDDPKDPINFYGQTKAEAEEYIIKKLRKYYLVRTSWLYGKNGKNFVETISKLCAEKPEIKVVNDQIGRPTFTGDLSRGILNLLKNKKEFGVYHLTNDGQCSWFEFAQEIARLQNSPCQILPCTTAEFPRPAKRPRYSVLNNKKTDKLREWKDALKEYLRK
ncbi:MAG: dTDP-4-dehydrorhamnose reductase [Patescibacteria group bacterium]